LSCFPLSSPPRHPPCSTPFPYTTLFRSLAARPGQRLACWRPLAPRAARQACGALRARLRVLYQAQPQTAPGLPGEVAPHHLEERDRKSTRLNSSHRTISYAVFCLKKKPRPIPPPPPSPCDPPSLPPTPPPPGPN